MGVSNTIYGGIVLSWTILTTLVWWMLFFRTTFWGAGLLIVGQPWAIELKSVD